MSNISGLTGFHQAVQAGEFLITAEVAPPKGGNPADVAIAIAHNSAT